MAKPTVIRVLAFDPGISNMGWAVIDYNLATGIRTVVKYGTLEGPKLLKEHKDQLPFFQKYVIVLDVYEAIVERMIRDYQPHYIASEDAFAHKFPQAFARLVLVIHTIRRVAKRLMARDIHIIAPMETKKTVAGRSMADKDEIRKGVLENERIVIRSTKQNPIELASEHVFDAIGHGVTFIELKLHPLLLELEATGLPLPQPITPIALASLNVELPEIVLVDEIIAGDKK